VVYLVVWADNFLPGDQITTNTDKKTELTKIFAWTYCRVGKGEPIVEYCWRAAKITWSKISAFIILRKIRTENFQRCDRAILISSAAAEERQDVSSKNTIREMSWRYHWRQRYRSLGPLVMQYAGKMRECRLKYEKDYFWHCDEKSFLKHDVPQAQHRKDRNLTWKCITSLIHHHNHNCQLADRSRLCFPPSQTCV